MIVGPSRGGAREGVTPHESSESETFGKFDHLVDILRSLVSKTKKLLIRRFFLRMKDICVIGQHLF